MLFLILAISFNVLVSVLLKVAQSKNIALEQAVAFNYISAIVLCFVLLKPAAISLEFGSIYLFLILGFLLPAGFIVMSKSILHAGIARSDAASRLSLFLPIIASFTIFGEELIASRAVAILFAFGALFCLCKKAGSKSDKSSMLWLILVFFVYGLADITFKQIAKQGNLFSSTLFVSFILAAIIIFVTLFIKKTLWDKKSMAAGLLLGVLNFFNILFYIKAHQVFKTNPSLVFTAMNIGVICVGTLVGVFIFREKISKTNQLGLLFGIISILFLTYF